MSLSQKHNEKQIPRLTFSTGSETTTVSWLPGKKKNLHIHSLKAIVPGIIKWSITNAKKNTKLFKFFTNPIKLFSWGNKKEKKSPAAQIFLFQFHPSCSVRGTTGLFGASRTSAGQATGELLTLQVSAGVGLADAARPTNIFIIHCPSGESAN